MFHIPTRHRFQAVLSSKIFDLRATVLTHCIMYGDVSLFAHMLIPMQHMTHTELWKKCTSVHAFRQLTRTTWVMLQQVSLTVVLSHIWSFRERTAGGVCVLVSGHVCISGTQRRTCGFKEQVFTQAVTFVTTNLIHNCILFLWLTSLWLKAISTPHCQQWNGNPSSMDVFA